MGTMYVLLLLLLLLHSRTYTPRECFFFSGGVKLKGVKKLKRINMINKNVLAGKMQFHKNVIYLFIY